MYLLDAVTLGIVCFASIQWWRRIARAGIVNFWKLFLWSHITALGIAVLILGFYVYVFPDRQSRVFVDLGGVLVSIPFISALIGSLGSGELRDSSRRQK